MTTNSMRTQHKDFGELRTFVQWLLLKPYGNALIAPQTRMWLLLARLIVATMASAEAAAWSYIAYNITDNIWQRIIAGVVGAAVFFVIAAIDTTFLTYDLSGSRYVIAYDSQSTLKRVFSGTSIGVLLRVAMVAGSLLITSPYLAQLLLAKDVIAMIDTQNKNAIAEVRKKVEQGFNARAAEQKKEIAALRQQSIDDAAGVGPSKRRGRGSTVRTIEARLEEAQRQAAAINAEKERKLAEFDNTSPTELSRQHGIRLLGNGVQSRSEVIQQLEQLPGYSGVRIPIYGFLIGIFLAIFALKVFQPRTAGIYFSETLQDAYVAYKAGLYDDLLPEKERSKVFEMPPVRFEHWWLTSEAIRQRAAAFNDEASQEENRQRVTEEAIADMERRVGAHMKPRLEEQKKLNDELAELEDDKREQEAAVIALKAHVDARQVWITTLDANLATLEANLRSDADVETLTRLVRVKTSLVKEITKTKTDLATTEMQLRITTDDLGNAQKQSLRLAKIIDEQAAALADAERRRTEAHKEHLDHIETLRKRYRAGA